MADVAVLGMGRMGAAMARKLVAAGHAVTIWNRSPAAAAQVVEQVVEQIVAGPTAGSIRLAPDAATAVAGAEFVISMLASGLATEAVLLSAAVLAALAPGVTVCDMGTSGVPTAHALDAAINLAGGSFVDAPVSGSVPTVEAGQLLIMAGGRADDVAAVSPLFDAFAKQVIHVGDVGTGQAMKLAVNLIVHDLNAAVSEGLVLASRSGIDPVAAYDVFQASVIGAPFVQYKRAAFLNTGLPVAMSLELVGKDLALITAQADRLDVAAVSTRAVQNEVAAACDAGYESQDMAALYRYLAETPDVPTSA